MCKPHDFSKLDWLEYRNKRSSIYRNQETFLKTLLKMIPQTWTQLSQLLPPLRTNHKSPDIHEQMPSQTRAELKLLSWELKLRYCVCRRWCAQPVLVPSNGSRNRRPTLRACPLPATLDEHHCSWCIS